MSNWIDKAECRGNTSIFYPEPGDFKTMKIAKSICKKCPVKVECLTHALDNTETMGIWGGLSYRSRADIKRKLDYNITFERVKEYVNYNKSV